jgi:hypothetical protein
MGGPYQRIIAANTNATCRNQVLQVPAVRAAITGAQAAEIVGATPQQFDAFIKSELKRWPEVAKELVDLRPDAIFSVTTPVTGALVRETHTIPIVIANVADPIASGFAVARPATDGSVAAARRRGVLRSKMSRLAHRDKSQSPEFTVGIDAKRTFVDKRSRPNLQRMTRSGHWPPILP